MEITNFQITKNDFSTVFSFRFSFDKNILITQSADKETLKNFIHLTILSINNDPELGSFIYRSIHDYLNSKNRSSCFCYTTILPNGNAVVDIHD